MCVLKSLLIVNPDPDTTVKKYRIRIRPSTTGPNRQKYRIRIQLSRKIGSGSDRQEIPNPGPTVKKYRIRIRPSRNTGSGRQEIPDPTVKKYRIRIQLSRKIGSGCNLQYLVVKTVEEKYLYFKIILSINREKKI